MKADADALRALAARTPALPLVEWSLWATIIAFALGVALSIGFVVTFTPPPARPQTPAQPARIEAAPLPKPDAK
jgi:hypothetical protein